MDAGATDHVRHGDGRERRRHLVGELALGRQVGNSWMYFGSPDQYRIMPEISSSLARNV